MISKTKIKEMIKQIKDAVEGVAQYHEKIMETREEMYEVLYFNDTPGIPADVIAGKLYGIVKYARMYVIEADERQRMLSDHIDELFDGILEVAGIEDDLIVFPDKED